MLDQRVLDQRLTATIDDSFHPAPQVLHLGTGEQRPETLGQERVRLDRVAAFRIASEKAAVLAKGVGGFFNEFLRDRKRLRCTGDVRNIAKEKIEIHFECAGRGDVTGMKTPSGRAHLQTFRKPLVEEQPEQCSEFGKRPRRRRSEPGFRVGDVPAEEPVGAQRRSLLRHPANRDTQAEWKFMARFLKARFSLSERYQDDPCGVQKGSQIPLNRVILAVEVQQSPGLGDNEAPLLVGWSVHEKPSLEAVEIEEDVPWANPLVGPPSRQPLKIGCSRLRTDVPVAWPVGHAIAGKVGAVPCNGQARIDGRIALSIQHAAIPLPSVLRAQIDHSAELASCHRRRTPGLDPTHGMLGSRGSLWYRLLSGVTERGEVGDSFQFYAVSFPHRLGTRVAVTCRFLRGATRIGNRVLLSGVYRSRPRCARCSWSIVEGGGIAGRADVRFPS